MDDLFYQLLSSSSEHMGYVDKLSWDSVTGGPGNCMLGTFQESSRVSTHLEEQGQNSVIPGENTPFLSNELLVYNEAPNHQDMLDPDILSTAKAHCQFDRNFPVGGNIEVSLERPFLHSTSAVSPLNATGPVSPHECAKPSQHGQPQLVSQPYQQNTGFQMLRSSQENSLPRQGNRFMVTELQSAATAGAVLNGAPGKRVRAGQVHTTAPRSIAERERRERIVKKLKSVHELVPNANKTNKASMLDEIIDHVKFLQQQVKVLSTGKFGGAGSVTPITANVPAEADSLDFEDTVLRYMEIDMNAAIEYLQKKGLSLIPTAQATALSSPTIKPGLGSRVTNFVDRQSSGNRSASLTANGCWGVLGIGSAGFGNDFSLKENILKNGERQFPTDEPDGREFENSTN